MNVIASERGAPRIEYDAIWSLGTNCEIAYNLRAFYGSQTTGLLDWTITPLSALLWLIERGFQMVGPKFSDELDYVEADGTDSVAHIPTGILLHHAFRRDDNDAITPEWRSEIPAVAEKYAFLGDRMGRLIRGAHRPLLFINRSGLHSAVTPDIRSRSEDRGIYRDVLDMFENRYPGANPTFAVMNGSASALEVVSHDPRVVSATVHHNGDWHEGIEGHYAGSASGWRTALASLPITMPQAEAGSGGP